MDDKPAIPSREERLAAKLRENLRRRKAQARALGAEEVEAETKGEGRAAAGKPALPKGEPKS